ncbi:MAG: DUF4062 domain-containing protein [Bacteriovoracaceae bacterium]|nr:DUF4062 domain-containing protein [Bacteriovoracaceae bacterium]
MNATNHTRPKYQVFIGPTYMGVHEILKSVAWSLMGPRFIPCGIYPQQTPDTQQWKIITNQIAQSDYYILLLNEQSDYLDDSEKLKWHEKEYDQAQALNIPVLVFMKDPSGSPPVVNENPEHKKQLKAFIQKVQSKQSIQIWTTPEDLCQKVFNAIKQQIERDEDSGGQRPGWFRGDKVPDMAVMDELARLSRENATLKVDLCNCSTNQEVIFTEAENKDFNYMFEQLNRQMTIVVKIKDSQKEEPTSVDFILSKVYETKETSVNLFTLLRQYVDAVSPHQFNADTFLYNSKRLLEDQYPLHKRYRYFLTGSHSIEQELKTYGLLKLEECTNLGAHAPQKNLYSEKFHRFIYWLEYNNHEGGEVIFSALEDHN